MNEKKKAKIYSKSQVASSFGVLFALFFLVVMVSPGTHLQFFIYPLEYLFGILALYALCPLMMAAGIVFAFKHRLFFPRLRVIFGIILASVGTLLLFARIGNSYLGEENYGSMLNEAYSSYRLAVEIKTGGGILFHLLDRGLLRVGAFLSILLIVFILLGAIVLLFWPLWKKAIRAIRGKIALASAEKKRKKLQEEGGISQFNLGSEEEAVEEKEEEIPALLPPVEEKKPVYKEEFVPSGHIRVQANSSVRENPSPSFEDILPSSNPDWEEKGEELEEAYFDFGDEPKQKEETPSMEMPFSTVEEPVVQDLSPVMPKAEEKPIEVEPIVEPHLEESPIIASNEPSFAQEEIPEEEIEPSVEEEEMAIKEATPVEEEIVEDVPPMPEAPVEEKIEPVTPPLNPEEAKMLELGIEPKKDWPEYTLPPLSLLKDVDNTEKIAAMDSECKEKTEIINKAFQDFKVGASCPSYTVGPSVTRFDIAYDESAGVQDIEKCIRNIRIRLNGVSARFVDVVAGKTTSGLEIANTSRATVSFKETIVDLSTDPKKSMLIPFGKNIEGRVVTDDLTKFPHMLIAGTSGSGKSVFMHGLLMTLLMRNRPEQLKLVLVDPKRVEMSKYRDIPHLLCPIVKEPNEARNCLKKLVEEMERRYSILEYSGVSGIREYNEEWAVENNKEPLPFIVCVLDEFGDLVQNCKDIADPVLLLAAKARAAGIHLIIATQRPDKQVITGTIKSNLNVRVALTVASAIDSTVIVGQGGAEELCGYGDMLIDDLNISKELVRAQGSYVTNSEIRAVTDYLRAQQKVVYDPKFLDLSDEGSGIAPAASAGATVEGPSLAELRAAGQKEKYEMIKTAIMGRDFTSISQIQRDFGVGFPRAGKIFAQLQQEGIIAMNTDSANNSKGVRVLIHDPSQLPNASNPGTLSQDKIS